MTDIVDQRIEVDVRSEADGFGDDVAPAHAVQAGDVVGGTGGPVAWARVCRLDQLTPGRGAAAMVGADQVAVFRVQRSGAGDTVFALGNRDPFSGAQVLARGIVGDAAGVLKVTSPVYKQGFALDTGACLDDPTVAVPTYPVAVCDEGWVSIAVPAP